MPSDRRSSGGEVDLERADRRQPELCSKATIVGASTTGNMPFLIRLSRYTSENCGDEATHAMGGKRQTATSRALPQPKLLRDRIGAR